MFCSLTGSCLPIYHMVTFSSFNCIGKMPSQNYCHESWRFVWTQSLTDTADHVKNYRPKLIVLTGNPATRFHHYFECQIYCNHMFSIIISLFAFWGLFITCYQYNNESPSQHATLPSGHHWLILPTSSQRSSPFSSVAMSSRWDLLPNFLKLRRNPELYKRCLKWSQNLGFS